MLSKDITGSLLAITIILMTPHVTRHFIIQVGTIIKGKHSDMD